MMGFKAIRAAWKAVSAGIEVHCVCAALCIAATPLLAGRAEAAGTLLYVTAGGVTLTAQEQLRIPYFHAFGYTVQPIAASAVQADFNTAVAGANVVYISEEITATALGTKLRTAAVGIVFEDSGLTDEFGFSSSVSSFTGTTINVVAPVALGSLTICSSNQPLNILAGTIGSGVYVVARQPSSSNITCGILEPGAAMYGGGTAPARRLFLPWGADAFDFNSLNANGLALLYEALGYTQSTSTTRFTDVSSSAGFNVTTASDDEGSGLHFGDLDSDGDLDAIITGSQARLLMKGSSTFTSSVFGGGSVRRQGALADFDNDGDLDFWAVNVGSYDAERAFRNNGSGAFSNIGDAGFSTPTNNEAVAAADVDCDGWCDLVMLSESGNYVGVNAASGSVAFASSNASVYGLHTGGNFGNGDYCSSGDFNNDGRPDLFYHYNSGKVFLSEGDGTYLVNNGGISVTTGLDDKFGSAWGDYDNDGDLDLFAARYDSGSTGQLWRNNGSTFTNVTATAFVNNIAGQRGACWGDYDNDGDLDLYLVTREGGNALYRNNDDGTFTLVNENVAATGNNHDGVFVDYDNDGDLDLAVTRQGTTNVLLRNSTNNTNYLKVRIIGAGDDATNVAGTGTRVELYDAAGTTLLARRDVGMARGFGGSEPLWLHFGGLNQNTTYTLKVYFLSGTQTVSVTPATASTTIGATTIQRMLTVTEQPAEDMEIIRWVEVDPLQP
jgi:enediyne biosynthesis protein E4